MTKLIKVEYTGKTSLGIYANATFEVEKFLRKPKTYTREVFLRSIDGKDNFFSQPDFVDTGNQVFFSHLYLSDAIYREMVRQYELNK